MYKPFEEATGRFTSHLHYICICFSDLAVWRQAIFKLCGFFFPAPPPPQLFSLNLLLSLSLLFSGMEWQSGRPIRLRRWQQIRRTPCPKTGGPGPVCNADSRRHLLRRLFCPAAKPDLSFYTNQVEVLCPLLPGHRTSSESKTKSKTKPIS